MILNRSTGRALSAALTIVSTLAMASVEAATITVTTVSDNNPPLTNGVCSLREALANASNDAPTYPDCPAGTGNDVITFGNHLFTPGNQFTATIQLAGRLVAGTAVGTTHELVIRPPGAIGGHPARVRLVASTGLPYAVLDVLPTAEPFVLERINIEGGRSSNKGGGIRLLSQDARFEEVHFINNQAKGGGALHQLNGNGKLQIDSSLFQDNRATEGGGGAIALDAIQPAHQVSIRNSAFIGNQATEYGGAVRLDVTENISGTGVPLVAIAHSRFLDNSTGVVGGGIYASTGEVFGNQRMLLQISDSLFQGNRAGHSGGGMWVYGRRDDTHSSVRVRRSSFIANQANLGAGIYSLMMNTHVENSLFAGNHSIDWGAAIYHLSATVEPKKLSLIGNSFHRQTSGSQPALGRTLVIVVAGDAREAELTISGNLFDPDTSAGGAECRIDGGHIQPPTLRGGDNLTPELTCRILGTVDIQANPMVEAVDSDDPLKPLLLLPQPGSPAIDAWPADACTNLNGQPLTVDLSGNPRPADGDASGIADCDIGAFELPGTFVDDIFSNGFE
jgi:hypothetical protein